MACIFWLYQSQRIIYICDSVKDVTWYSSKSEYLTGYKKVDTLYDKKCMFSINPSFFFFILIGFMG